MNGPKGREYCNDGVGPHPFYVNVDLTNGNIANHWIDSLQAAFPGVQVLFGDLGKFYLISSAVFLEATNDPKKCSNF